MLFMSRGNRIAHAEPTHHSSGMSDLSRHELQAELRAIRSDQKAFEADVRGDLAGMRADMATQAIGLEQRLGRADESLARVDTTLGNIERTVGDLRSSIRSVILTVIVSAIAVVGVLLTAQSNQIVSFQTGLSAAQNAASGAPQAPPVVYIPVPQALPAPPQPEAAPAPAPAPPPQQ